MGLFRGSRPPEDARRRWPETTRLPTEVVGIAPGWAGLYEFATVDGVPVRLHDMSFTDLEYRVRPSSLTLRLRYEDPLWTPPEAVDTPVAVFTFERVQVWQWEDDADLLETPSDARGQVRTFSWYAPTRTFDLGTTDTILLFAADRLTVHLEAAPGQPL